MLLILRIVELRRALRRKLLKRRCQLKTPQRIPWTLTQRTTLRHAQLLLMPRPTAHVFDVRLALALGGGLSDVGLIFGRPWPMDRDTSITLKASLSSMVIMETRHTNVTNVISRIRRLFLRLDL